MSLSNNLQHWASKLDETSRFYWNSNFFILFHNLLKLPSYLRADNLLSQWSRMAVFLWWYMSTGKPTQDYSSHNGFKGNHRGNLKLLKYFWGISGFSTALFRLSLSNVLSRTCVHVCLCAQVQTNWEDRGWGTEKARRPGQLLALSMSHIT